MRRNEEEWRREERAKWLLWGFEDVRLTVLWWEWGCRVCQTCVLWSANLATVWLQSSWESVQGCLFRPVTFPAVSSATALFEYTNTLSTIVRCVFRFQSDVSPDDQAQQAGRQQQFERWDTFSCWVTSTLLFLIHLTFSTSSWQTQRGSMDLQASRSWRPRWQRCPPLTAPRTTQVCARNILLYFSPTGPYQ